ncbi:MAG: DUF4331 family protein [Deltaproteobacteria bacterium]|nr:DUF4331 family protein [Deltaproteobacteria bacterium]
MKQLAFLGAGVAVGCALLLAGRGHAADHIDSDTLAAAPLAMGDINDVYAWMSSDGSKVNLVMTVSPADPGGRSFGPGVQYVFHLTSKAGAAADVVNKPASGVTTTVICTFPSTAMAQCWVNGGSGVKDYVSGDASNTAGTTSSSGKLRLFAGRRSDPFFFNLQGFRAGTAQLNTFRGAAISNQANCPQLSPTNAGIVRTTLAATQTTATTPCPANQPDCFANLNVMALVVQVDKSLVNAPNNTILSVWGSTHMVP